MRSLAGYANLLDYRTAAACRTGCADPALEWADQIAANPTTSRDLPVAQVSAAIQVLSERNDRTTLNRLRHLDRRPGVVKALERQINLEHRRDRLPSTRRPAFASRILAGISDPRPALTDALATQDADRAFAELQAAFRDPVSLFEQLCSAVHTFRLHPGQHEFADALLGRAALRFVRTYDQHGACGGTWSGSSHLHVGWALAQVWSGPVDLPLARVLTEGLSDSAFAFVEALAATGPIKVTLPAARFARRWHFELCLHLLRASSLTPAQQRTVLADLLDPEIALSGCVELMYELLSDEVLDLLLDGPECDLLAMSAPDFEALLARPNLSSTARISALMVHADVRTIVEFLSGRLGGDPRPDEPALLYKHLQYDDHIELSDRLVSSASHTTKVLPGLDVYLNCLLADPDTGAAELFEALHPRSHAAREIMNRLQTLCGEDPVAWRMADTLRSDWAGSFASLCESLADLLHPAAAASPSTTLATAP